MKNKQQQINDPILPPKYLEEEYKKAEKLFYELLSEGMAQKAYLIWKKYYEKILEKQPKDQRFHKGGPVHNMGIAKLLANAPGMAFKLFLLGYIEDVLSNLQEPFGKAENAPGALTLKSIFQLKDKDFLLLREDINLSVKEKGVIQKPEYIRKKYLSRTEGKRLMLSSIILSLLIKQRYSVSNIPGIWENRIFVGGDYRRLDILNKIKKRVEVNGFVPILAVEFKMPRDKTHHHSLLLMHNCKRAIFDVTTRSGQLMEAERIFDYGMKSIFICEENNMKNISSMIESYGIKIQPFSDETELENIIDNFLKTMTQVN